MVTQTHTQSIREIMIIVKVIKEGRTRKSGNVDSRIHFKKRMQGDFNYLQTVLGHLKNFTKKSHISIENVSNYYKGK